MMLRQRLRYRRQGLFNYAVLPRMFRYRPGAVSCCARLRISPPFYFRLEGMPRSLAASRRDLPRESASRRVRAPMREFITRTRARYFRRRFTLTLSTATSHHRSGPSRAFTAHTDDRCGGYRDMSCVIANIDFISLSLLLTSSSRRHQGSSSALMAPEAGSTGQRFGVALFQLPSSPS